jgi:hypothetical protein
MEYKRVTYKDKYNCVQTYSEFTETDVIEHLADLEDKIDRLENKHVDDSSIDLVTE